MITFQEAEPQIVAWLKENGVEPRVVARNGVPEVLADGSVRLATYLLNGEGKKYAVRGEPAMGEVVVRSAENAPEAVKLWLNGEVRP